MAGVLRVSMTWLLLCNVSVLHLCTDLEFILKISNYMYSVIHCQIYWHNFNLVVQLKRYILWDFHIPIRDMGIYKVSCQLIGGYKFLQIAPRNRQHLPWFMLSVFDSGWSNLWCPGIQTTVYCIPKTNIYMGYYS